MNKRSLFLIACLLSGTTALAQETAILSGSLLETDQKTGLVGANVLLILVKDTTQQRVTSTDANGYFEFKNLISSYYKIHYSSIGYKAGQKLVRVIAPVTKLEPFIVPEEIETLNEIEVRGKNLAFEINLDQVLKIIWLGISIKPVSLENLQRPL